MIKDIFTSLLPALILAFSGYAQKVDWLTVKGGTRN